MSLHCLDVRRQLLAAPATPSEAVSVHLSQCVGCRDFHKTLLNDEQKIGEALRVTVPHGLAERVLLNKKMRSRSRYGGWAMAASILFGVSVLYFWRTAEHDDTEWAAVAAEHVADERETLSLPVTQSDAQLALQLTPWHISLRQSLGRISYIGRCALPQGQGMHLVFETNELGKITLILPPQQASGKSGRARYGDYVAEAFQREGKWFTLVSTDANKLIAARQWLDTRLAIN